MWLFPLCPFLTMIGEQVETFPGCTEVVFDTDVVRAFGLVLPCSLNASSFFTACGLAAPKRKQNRFAFKLARLIVY